jgi:hypothetical protein
MACAWEIEAMSSEYKKRGFNLEDGQIEGTDTIDRVFLVLSLALYWAGSTRNVGRDENKTPPKNKPRGHPKTSRAA